MESEVHLRPAVPEATTDEPAIKEVISKVKSQGLFDQFRKECIADVDTKPAYHNLLQRVESYVEHFLQGQKWSLSANKNQLRETLRRRLHNSGMMQNGVERIIEQVVNPKILLGIKPKIDEAVCDHLGIDLKARQEEQQRRRQEQQKLLLQQMQQQQQHVQSLQSQNVKNGEPVFPTSGSTPSAGTNPWVNPAMVNYPSSSIPGVGAPAPGVPGANPQTMGGNFPGMVPPFPLMPGWMPGFNPGGGMAPMMPGQPMIPAFPGPPGVVSPAAGMGPRPPFNASSAAGVVTPSASTTTGSVTTSPRAGHSLSTSTPVVGGQMQVPNLSQPPPVLPIPGVPSSASNVVTNRIGASPIISPMVPPGTSPLAPPGTSPLAPPGTSPVVIPGTSRVAPAPHGSIPPPPGTVPVSENAKSNPLQGTPHIPALLSHTLAKVSEDELTPEKIAVFKTAAAFITKTVNNAGGAAAGDLATILSPRVLAEAMMKDCGKPMTKAEIRAVKRKERYKEMERLRAEREEKEAIENENQVKTQAEGDDDKENPLPPPKHNLMDVFQGAEDVSDDEEALDMLMDVEEPTEEAEDKNKQGIVLSDEEDLDANVEKPPTSQPGKRYNFTWDVNLNSGDMSDVTVSSVHTSDMSSFEDDDEENDMFSDIVSEEEKMKETTPEKAVDEGSQKVDIEDEAHSVKTEGLSPGHIDDVVEEAINTDVTNTADESEIDIKVEKDLELDKSKTEKTEDTEEIETVFDENEVEEKKAVLEQPEESVSVASQDVKTEPVQTAIDVTQTEGGELSSKPRKLLALSYHYSDSDDEETREERKARIAKEKEERYLKRQQRRAELDAKKKERDEEKARIKREKQMQKEKGPVETEDKSCSATDTTQTDAQATANTSIEVESSSQNTPRKRKNKAEMKEQLLQQKVMEKKAALRRKRTRNRRYASDEFTSIFSDHKKLNQSYTDGVNQEEIVTFEGDGALEIVEMTVDMTVDQECIVETVGEEIETSNAETSEGGKDLVLQCPSPYSDISDRSMSEKSEPENITDDDDDPGVDQVSSDDELGDLEEVKIVEEIEESSSKGHMSPSQSASESDVGQILSEAAMTPDASRMSSARSKSMSQDEIESVFSGHSIDKRKPSGTSLSQDDDIESQTSQLEISAKSSIKSISDTVENEVKTSKIDDVTDTTATTDSPAKDIMGELELEPVSDEDSLGGLDDEEDEGDDRKVAEADEKRKEEKESDKESLSISHPLIKVERKSSSDSRKLGKVDTENASDEGEIKSESEKEEEKEREDDEDLEEKRRRAANRKPIHQVDFGEAARRARVQRGIFNISGETQDWRGRPVGMTNPNTPNYRGGFNTWTPAGASSIPQFGPPKSGNRFMGHESMSPIRAKSPGAFDAESENSSHSRSSVRVRDDIPPPYPIEGVNMGRKHRSPASSSDNAVDYKPLSPPSPVSSTSSRSHSRSRSRSRSRSSSPALSRTSSLSSRSAASSSKKPKRSKRSKRKKRKKERQRRTSLSPRPSPVRLPSEERRISPRNSPDLHNPAITHPVRNIHSGNESISSDELPNFSDDEIEQKTIHTRSGSFSSGSSSVGLSKRLKKDSPGSISSSELIYSPTRTKLASGDESNNSYSSSGSSKRIKRRKRRRSSSVKSDQSSDLPPVSPIRESPHGPSSPISYPPLPADMSGFQPPLPEEPMPIDLPPLPPQPPSPPPIQRNRPSISEEEEGECPSTPEQPPSPDNDDDDSQTQIPPGYDNDKLRHSPSQNNSESSSQYGQSKSDIEQTDLVDVCVSKKNDLNFDVNENFPPPADTSSSLSQDTVNSPSDAISHTRVLEEATVDKNETSDKVETDKQNSPFLQKTEEKMQPSEIHCVNTEMLVTEEAKSAPLLSQSPPPPVPPSTPPSSPPPSPPAAALNGSIVTVTEESTKDIPTLDAPSNPDLCSFQPADSSISSHQSPTHKSDNIITSSSPDIDITCGQSNTIDSQNPDDGAKDRNLSSEEVTGASSPQENEQSIEGGIPASTSRKRSAQDVEDDSASMLANEHSTKKQKRADD